MEKVAAALKVPADAIKNFDQETAVYHIQNNFEGSNTGASNLQNISCTFNPIEKLMEALEENKRLYEARLKDKEEMIATLQQLLKKV